MQGETMTQICPLCRRAAQDEDAAMTRLCHDCRAMLEPILPRVGIVQTDYAVALAGSAARPVTSINATLVHDADFEEVSFVPAAAVAEEFAPLNEDTADAFDARLAANAPAATTRQTFVHHLNPPAPAWHEDPELFITPDQYEDDDVNTAVNAATSAPAITPPALPERADRFAEVEMTEAAPIADLRAAASTTALESRAAHDDAREGEPDSHGLIVEAVAPAALSADPWDDPLPAWEYSRSEWPLLVKEEKPSATLKLKWPLIAVLVIVLSAAVYFFFISRRGQAPLAQSGSETGAQTPLTVPVEPLKSVEQPKPADASPATPASPAAATPGNNSAPPATVSQATEAQWKHALQAMASPNEGEANSFAERLKNAAIPAYVVRADLGSHGVWYRVRIGRFATPAEAQRYAAEARTRARIAGVALKDLQVAAYDKP
jgi:cell division septation protein DedD